jgi:2-iminobutanoate/2-iminopropanoate deaminase
MPLVEGSAMTKGFETSNVWKARGRGFQMGTLQPEGVTVYLTGQVAWNSDEEIVGLGDVEAQTRQCFENIKCLLAEVGGDLSDIVAITTYFTDRTQLPKIQRIRNEFLKSDAAPASTSVMVAGLGHEDLLVELTPIAVVPHDRFKIQG